MNKILFAAALMTSSFAFGQTVSKAKVSELAAHRVDRLVTLGRIDASFVKRLEKIEVTSVNQPPVAFKVRVLQTAPAQGQPVQLDLSFDKDGKALAHQVISGTVGTDPQWTDKDAASLAENALHYVIDNANNPKVKKFNEGLTSFTLTKGDLNGDVVARGQMASSQTTEKLNIYLKLDGTLISTEIVP